MFKKKRLLPLLLIAFFFIWSKSSTEVLAASVDLREFIAKPNFTAHYLSTGEYVQFSGEGSPGPGTAVRQYKNNNYEQFFIADGILRREDTSWAPLPGFGDALCSSGGKAIYTLDKGCNSYSSGQQVTTDGAIWITPGIKSEGESWDSDTHQIVTVSFDEVQNSGTRNYCSLSNLSGYGPGEACGVSTKLQLVRVHAPGAFTFCTDIKNSAQLVEIEALAGPGAGETFYYMRGYGLVGFKGGGLEVGLLDAEGKAGPNPTCSIGSIAAPPIPFELKNVDCTAFSTQDPEYHSLRPYPANACSKRVTGTTMCSNDLIVKEVFDLTAAQSNGNCGQDATVCSYTIQSTSTVTVDLTNAQLPIAGNTELVPNAITSVAKINYAQRVNEYLSWYLNGIPFRAEEKEFKASNPVDLDILINYSGPLRKLMPAALQQLARFKQFENIGMNTDPESDASTTRRHDQGVACGTQDNPEPCPPGGRGENFITRISEIAEPPGGGLLDLIDFVSRFFGGYSIYQMNQAAFKYTPFSSTEDRIGQAKAGVIANEQYRGDTKVSISDVVFTPSVETKNLYFPHMQSNSELADMLQKTFLPGGTSAETIATLPEDVIPAEALPYCEFEDTATNPGDSLYGQNLNIRTPAENQITGSFSYTAKFDCEMTPGRVETVCVDGAFGQPPSCREVIIPPKCHKEVAAGLGVFVMTPLAEEPWTKLVAGATSVVRRMFPKPGENTPLVEIKDIPARSTAKYVAQQGSATANSSSIAEYETQALAGDPGRGRSGESASIYFPHLGSVQEYFLDGIQKALRPFGMNNEGGITITNPTADNSMACTPEFMSSFGDQAETALCIAKRESVNCTDIDNISCLTLGGSWDYSYGIFQINLLAHPAYSDIVPDELRKMWRSHDGTAAEIPGYVWSCKHAFNDPLDTVPTSLDGWIGSTDANGKMTTTCKPGQSAWQQAALQDCVNFFSNPVHSRTYVQMFLARPGGDWSPWATHGSCGV